MFFGNIKGGTLALKTEHLYPCRYGMYVPIQVLYIKFMYSFYLYTDIPMPQKAYNYIVFTLVQYIIIQNTYFV